MTKRDFVALAFSLSLLVTAVPNSSCSFSSSSSSNSICKSDEERGIEEKGSCEDDDDDDPAEATLGPIVDSGLMDETLNGLDQRDHRLVKEVGRFLESPSEKPYNFNKGKEGLALKGQFGQTPDVERLFFGRWPEKGFFLEAGAYDGEYISNTLLFEVKHGWSGLLVEPNPDALAALRSKNRKAWILGNCLSTQATPEVVEFDSTLLFGGIVNPKTHARSGDEVAEAERRRGHRHLHQLPGGGGLRRRRIRVQCLPLYSLLAAMGQTTVHYLVLDIEGAELQVLENIPWDLLDIKVIQVEVSHIGKIFGGTVFRLENILKRAGYVMYKKYHNVDRIYVKKDFMDGLES